MKVLLIYPGTIVREIPLNILYVASALKSAKINTKLFEFTPYPSTIHTHQNHYIKKAFTETILSYKPDLVAISLMTINYDISLELAKIAHDNNIKTLCGGIHPTISPEITIKDPNIDYICIGEGEKSAIQLTTALQLNKDTTKIEGIWAKIDKTIYRNPISQLENDLDKIQPPDRSLLPDSYYSDQLIGTNILTSRGCPYLCSFCQNKFLMYIYKTKGNFIRYRTFTDIFAEIDFLIARYDIKKLYFSDETFTLNKHRLLNFLSEYKKRYDIPFMCQTRIDKVDEEIIKSLKSAGCFHLSLAIECGNEEIRKNTLQKPITNQQIINVFDLARHHNLRTQSFNMIGIPGETVENIFDTIKINKTIQPDRILTTIYMPFKGTELGEKCFSENIVINDPKHTTNYYNVTSIKYNNINPKDIIGYQGFFDWYVRFPSKYYKIIDILRIIYQNFIGTQNPKNPTLLYLRTKIVDFAYWSKKYLPNQDYHVQKR